MAIGDISLTAAARSNLQALKNTTNLLETTQVRLATGKKVNSANDDAVAFFASRGFLNTANALATIKDTITTNVEAITSFNNSIDSISKVVNQLQGLTTQALGTNNTDTRAALATQYNALISQMDELVDDAIFNGTNLLNDTSVSLITYFNQDNSTKLEIKGIDLKSTALLAGNNTAAGNWATTANIQTTQSALLTALATLTSEAASFGGNATFLATRRDFTANMIDSLSNASSRLTAADVNEEGANMQALQAQAQLGIVSLGVSGTLAGAILRIL